jgi:hypothetical protein
MILQFALAPIPGPLELDAVINAPRFENKVTFEDAAQFMAGMSEPELVIAEFDSIIIRTSLPAMRNGAELVSVRPDSWMSIDESTISILRAATEVDVP